MNPRKPSKKNPLRKRAERMLSERSKTTLKVPGGDTKELIHELQVHQIELEMQNEELRRAQGEIEQSRSKYVDLYEFAPVGYFTLTPMGRIAELNLAGAGLLGLERVRYINRAFSEFVAPDFRPVFREHQRKVLAHAGKEGKERCELKLLKKDGTPFYASLESVGVGEGPRSRIRSAVTDITEWKRAEEEVRRLNQELEQRVVERTVQLTASNEQLEREIADRKRVEKELQGVLAESQRRKAEVDALLEAARAVLHYGEFQDSARAIFDSCKNLIGATAGYVALLSEDGKENEVLFLDSGGLPCSVDAELSMPIRGLREQVYLTGLAAFHNDFGKSAYAELLPEGHVDLFNVLFAPLTADGRTIGLLGLANKPGGFTGNDARLAGAFGELASVALRNSRTLEALRLNEERFRIALKNSPITVFNQDRNLHYDWVYNPMILPRAEPMLGKSDYEIFSGEDASRIAAIKLQVLKDGGGRREEVSITLDGGKRFYGLTLEPLREAGGEVVGITGAFVDLTERKKMEEALRQSQAMLRCLFESNIIGIVVGDNEEIVEVNDAFLNMIGLAREKFPANGIKWREITPPEYFHVDAKGLQELVTQGSWTPYEKEYIRQDGSRVPVMVGAAMIERSPLQWVCFVLDITARKKMEGELRRSRDELELRVQVRTQDLFKRLKELICLYTVSSLLNEGEGPFAAVLQKAVQAVPSGWQFSEVAGARMTLEAGEFKTNDFKETPWRQRSDILCRGRLVGALEVCYLEEKPARDEGPFLKEERILINSLADQVGTFVEARQAQESLRGSHELLESVFSSIGLHIAHMDKDFNFIRVNRAYAAADGREPEFFPGKNHFALFPNEENEAIFRNVVETGEPFIVMEKPFAYEKNPEQGVTYWDWSLHPVKEADGTISGVVLSLVEVTERKKAQQDLRRTEEERLRLAAAVEQISEGILMSDREGKILYVNRAFEGIHGIPRKEILGQKHDAFLMDEVKGEELHGEIGPAVSESGIWSGHITRIKPDGSPCELEVTVSPIRDPLGAVINYVAVEHDVTEEMGLQEHLRQWQKMEALGTLAGGIAHDFNNILMPILINTDLALLDIQEEKLPSGHSMQVIREAAIRGQALVKQIVTFSRQKEQLRRPVDLVPVLKESIKFLRSAISPSIEIRESIGFESAVAQADPTRIHQVVMNLCSNAAHAMREKGGLLEVSLTRVEAGQVGTGLFVDLKPQPYLLLAVKDTGHGMDREVRERAFDPFFTTKKPGEGTGMGLAVVHGIVKDHEGAVTLESETGKGTTVNVFLPEFQGDWEAETVLSGPIPTGKERILLVDDEEVQVRSVQSMLDRLGYRVIGKTNPREALAIFLTQPDSFDLVITDQTMPELTGANLAKELLAIRPDLPIILFTGFSEVIDEEEAKTLGVRDFALKPLTLRDLAERIRKVLRK